MPQSTAHGGTVVNNKESGPVRTGHRGEKLLRFFAKDNTEIRIFPPIRKGEPMDDKQQTDWRVYDALGSLCIHAFRLAKANNQFTGEGNYTPYITQGRLWELIEKILDGQGIDIQARALNLPLSEQFLQGPLPVVAE
jgi:hypothetical protein